MGHLAGILLGFEAGQRKRARKGIKSKTRERFILRLSASLARALEGEFNLFKI